MLIAKRLPFWFVFEKIKYEFLIILFFSIIIGYLDKTHTMSKVPLTATTILGTMISLLLAFRTGQAYDRWWEARILWGAIVNNSRTLVRDFQTFLKADDAEFKKTIDNVVRYNIAWVYALGQSLRKHEVSLEPYLTTEEIDSIKAHSNIPNAILGLINQEIRRVFLSGMVNEWQQTELTETVIKHCDSMGACERIKNTVFPQTYSTLLHYLIFVFSVMLPFSLIDYPVAIEILINVVISSAFFLIEKTAIYKQDPFEGRPTDTSVTSIARTIDINLRQMQGFDGPIPKPVEPVKFYLM